MTWKIIVSLAVVALFYVGHGLHDQGSITPEANGQVVVNGLMGGSGASGIMTQSADGLTLYVWSWDGVGYTATGIHPNVTSVHRAKQRTLEPPKQPENPYQRK